MKVMAIQVAENDGGTVELLIRTALTELECQGIDTETIRFDGPSIRDCAQCRRSFLKGNRQCKITGDPAEECLLDMIDADAIILGAPRRLDSLVKEVFSLMNDAGLLGSQPDLRDILSDGDDVIAANEDVGIAAFDMNHRFVYVKYVSPLNRSRQRRVGSKAAVVGEMDGDTVMKDLGLNLSLMLNNFKSMRKELPYGKNRKQLDGSYRQYAAA
jgi:hypothetical protein